MKDYPPHQKNHFERPTREQYRTRALAAVAEFPESTKKALLKYYLQCFGDFIAHRNNWPLNGMEALHFSLIEKYHWDLPTVRALSFDDLKFLCTVDVFSHSFMFSEWGFIEWVSDVAAEPMDEEEPKILPSANGSPPTLRLVTNDTDE